MCDLPIFLFFCNLTPGKYPTFCENINNLFLIVFIKIQKKCLNEKKILPTM